MPGNPREMITMAERRFPVRIRVGVPAAGFGTRHTQMTRLARRELRLRWLGDDAVGDARGRERCRVDLFPRRQTRECVCRPVVRRAPKRRRMAESSGCGRITPHRGSGHERIGPHKGEFRRSPLPELECQRWHEPRAAGGRQVQDKSSAHRCRRPCRGRSLLEPCPRPRRARSKVETRASPEAPRGGRGRKSRLGNLRRNDAESAAVHGNRVRMDG